VSDFGVGSIYLLVAFAVSYCPLLAAIRTLLSTSNLAVFYLSASVRVSDTFTSAQ